MNRYRAYLDLNLTRTISPSWFLTVYLNVLSSYKIAVNVMDLFICDGARVLFQLALIVLYKQVWSLWQFFVRSFTVVTFFSEGGHARNLATICFDRLAYTSWRKELKGRQQTFVCYKKQTLELATSVDIR